MASKDDTTFKVIIGGTIAVICGKLVEVEANKAVLIDRRYQVLRNITILTAVL